MKIYGYRFHELYHAFTWQFRLLIVVGGAFLLLLLIHLTMLATVHDRRVDAGPLQVNGDAAYNGYDPVLVAGGGGIALAFTSLQQVAGDKGELQYVPSVMIATGDPTCSEWTSLALPIGFLPHPGIITAPDRKTTIAAGMWRYETPGLVYDPSDPDPNSVWKLYALTYMWTNDKSLAAAQRYSAIAMRAAPAPGGPWSPEVWAFGAKDEYPPAPYDEMARMKLNSLNPSLSEITMYARPSVIDAEGTLVMSLSAFTDERTPDRVVMFASSDHGATWRYLGTPLTVQDAKAEGAGTLIGATLLKKGGHVYLSAVFGDKLVAGLGTFVFSFDDFAKGSLKRDAKGRPVLLTKVDRVSKEPTETGGGFATYSDACPRLGMVTGEFSGLKRKFQIFRTMKQPDGAD